MKSKNLFLMIVKVYFIRYGLWMNMMEAHMKALLEVAKQDVMRSWACYCSSYHGNIHQEFQDQCFYVRIRGKKQI